MAKNLLIVESPTKAKTISKFLASEFMVESSYGHVRDLPKSQLGVDVDGDFSPHYVIPKANQKRLTALKKQAAKAAMVYYATDQDREGEAIAWHLAEYFALPAAKQKRISFHEITRSAVIEAIKEPRDIDQNLVDAQQARRIIDRLVGYKLSPFLWKKVARGLSAGRVQSVAVRLIVEREREIQAFQAQDYWTIEANFATPKAENIVANLVAVNGKTLKKFSLASQQQANELVDQAKVKNYTISSADKKSVKRNPLPPFQTSTLQQAANRRFGFSAKQTMMIAQQLYEGLDVGTAEQLGLITYMRTDSLSLSEKFLAEAQIYIKENYGPQATSGARHFKTKSRSAQEAHEAIRPTDVTLSPDKIKNHLSPQQFKLYDLIWRRALASQMAPAELLNVSLDIVDQDKKFTFKATGQTVSAPGFLALYPLDVKENLLPEVSLGQKLNLQDLQSLQHTTQPPARYSDATLVKALEEKEIGRPSTYAPTIGTITERGYVTREENRLVPQEIAFLVNDLLVEHFPNIVDYDFTAEIEKELDEVAEAKRAWRPVIKEFYQPFAKNLEIKTEELSRQEITNMREIGRDPQTGQAIYVRRGRYGPFVQQGEATDDKKPRFAPLAKGQNMSDVSLDDAIRYLSLPKTLGVDKSGENIEVLIGRFGPYLKVGKKNYRLNDADPYTLTFKQANSIIAAAAQEEAKAIIKEFPDTTIIVKVGRYGPYITDGTNNARIPKDTEPQNLTLQTCQELLVAAAARPKRPRRNFKKKAKT